MNVNDKYPGEIQWIKKYKYFLNLKVVAEETGIPPKNLWNFCNDVHSLNKIHWPKAIKWVQKTSFKSE